MAESIVRKITAFEYDPMIIVMHAQQQSQARNGIWSSTTFPSRALCFEARAHCLFGGSPNVSGMKYTGKSLPLFHYEQRISSCESDEQKWRIKSQGSISLSKIVPTSSRHRS